MLASTVPPPSPPAVLPHDELGRAARADHDERHAVARAARRAHKVEVADRGVLGAGAEGGELAQPRREPEDGAAREAVLAPPDVGRDARLVRDARLPAGKG